MNLLDRTIAAIAPQAGVRRMAARAALVAGTALSAAAPTLSGERIVGPGGYNAGKSDRRQTSNWWVRGRSANGDSAQRKTLVARSRDAVMNMPLATALIDRRVTFVVGTGMMAIPQLDAERLGIDPEVAAMLTAQIMRDYDRYMSSKDPDAERVATGYQQQEIVLRGRLTDGDILAIRCMPENQPGRRVQTAWKLIEGDRVVSPFGHIEGTKLGGTGPVVVYGVELDAYGAAQAYHVLQQAPDQFGTRRGGDTVRIQAWGEKSQLPNALLVMQKKRAEQARGVPVLGPSLESLQQASQLTEAELFAAVMTSMVAITYKSPGAGALPEADYGDGEIVQADYRPETLGAPTGLELKAGTVWELDSEGEIDVKAPGRPNPAFDPFFMALARQIGAAGETPASVLMMEFNASYTASKAELETYYATVRRDQGALSSELCDPQYEAWLYEQVAKGRYPEITGFFTDPLRRELWSAVRHRGDGKISLQPLQEAKALEIFEAHGWRTAADITAETSGADYDSNVKTRVGEHQRWIAGGLPVPGAQGGGSAPAADHASGASDPAPADNGDSNGQ